MNLQDLLNDAFKKTQRDMGHINILIAGRTGVGKSTLINSVFESNLAETGQGRPVTSTTREVTKEGIPLTLFDTRGLETKEYAKTFEELEKLITDRCGDRDSNRHIHLAWLCIHEDGRRVEEAEIALHEMLARHVPVIAVITKARSDNGFRNEVIQLLPQSRSAVRVRAISEKLDEGIELPPMGLKNLIEASSGLIPEGTRNAFAAAQKADMNYKNKRARTIVAGAVTAAAAAGASPIPFSDVAILAPIQVTMLAGITSIYGFELSKASLMTLVSSLTGVGGAALAGRAIVSNLIKFIPGLGTLAGGAISGTTVAILTTALGEAYIRTLEAFFVENPDARPNAEDLAARFKKELKGANLTP
jgi:uncharacterized protein (DUF697 family)/GTP-binding protein EngB required for normal cell division